MKQSGACPKCGEREIVNIRGRWVSNNGYGSVIVPGNWTLAKPVPLTRYICLGCGYSEEWIDEEKDLARLRKKFGKG